MVVVVVVMLVVIRIPELEAAFSAPRGPGRWVKRREMAAAAVVPCGGAAVIVTVTLSHFTTAVIETWWVSPGHSSSVHEGSHATVLVFLLRVLFLGKQMFRCAGKRSTVVVLKRR